MRPFSGSSHHSGRAHVHPEQAQACRPIDQDVCTSSPRTLKCAKATRTLLVAGVHHRMMGRRLGNLPASSNLAARPDVDEPAFSHPTRT